MWRVTISLGPPAQPIPREDIAGLGPYQPGPDLLARVIEAARVSLPSAADDESLSPVVVPAGSVPGDVFELYCGS